ncbi:putative outer membrane receptor protein [Flavobacterium cauense R2A-7]|uniref:Outer membrane cobalamin receptor n=1 Tax=Flavobacterium cauense R2A-7 TaxID=1341154 RepID=V6S2F2_9FLAO|nr:carboxypeptidase-like regulatory domain-containing protein [Flavobacterium cauense]ESU20579.1 putative outer membrane receptor protein [Flavobacterium cauense R2A-7]KGO83033.1 TonB-dependent receptor [Flavobacterium cauense R2A-7]TWI10201.1 outer membrane cobalamin receptor [Flavobacterium cauense R2A-7]
MKTVFTFLVALYSMSLLAQTTISGKVTDNKGRPIEGANVFIEGAYDGTTSDAKGDFTFTTTEKGNQTLVVTYLSFETQRTAIVIETYQPQTLKLRESVNTLDAVVISAGTFKAGDNSKVSALKPLDIVTTAGAAGDIIGALQTLPGAQIVGESGRLFVRGGESDETQTYVDGIRVAQPYGATANNLPTRGRFSPFLFSGMTFSTGGYSAEFGDALSSVLLLNTTNEADQEQTNLSFMTVGLGASNTQKWKKSSLTFNTSYINLEPYQKVIKQNVDWVKPYQSLSGESVFRRSFENGLFKFYAAFDYAMFNLNQKDVNSVTPLNVDTKNNNFYLNSSYKGSFGSGWSIQTGISFGFSQNKIGLDVNDLNNRENASHMKLKLTKKFSDRINLTFGGDYFITDFDETYKDYSFGDFTYGYRNTIGAAFVETDIFFSKKLAAKVGVRAMNSDLLGKSTVDPRVSLAYKTSKNGQVSVAYGDFHQNPKQDYLKFHSDFNYEKTTHYILNYLYATNGKTLRAEVFFKDYKDLVKYDSNMPLFNSQYNNNGYGYAKGLDVFWRDNKSVKNLDYWVSYSFIDSKRDYKNYEAKVTPNFVANHTLSLVGKYWINDWKSQLSVTNSFATGRPYDNPNETAFMNGKTKSYNSLSMSWAYLLSQQKILYFSVSNVLGNNNVFGYQYANSPDLAGQFQRQAITQPADRFFFIGFFWTISQDKSKNQLENL